MMSRITVKRLRRLWWTIEEVLYWMMWLLWLVLHYRLELF